MVKKALLLYFMITMVLLLPASAGDNKVPQEKHPRLDATGALRGSGFRITIVHPMRGDFTAYGKVEIVSMSSEIGARIPAEEMEKYTENLVRSFQQTGVFKEVARIEEAQLPERPAGAARASAPLTEVTENALRQSPPCSFDGPMAFFSDCSQPSSQSEIPNISVAQQPETPQPQENGAGTALQERPPNRTLVITNEAIYYKEGSRGMRAIGLGFGRHRFVVRFRIYDKERGQELAMGNISGEVDTGFGSVPLLAGNSDARNSAVAALVNRVEVRRAMADQ